LLISAFFMLSDPKTMPASLAGCLLYGTWVALLGWTLHYLFSTPNAFLYALILSSPLTLSINRYLPGKTLQDLRLAQRGGSPMNMKPIHWLLLCLLTAPNLASSFCGFYVAKKELRELGVFWLKADRPVPRPRPTLRIVPPGPGAKDVYITRLHLRYDRERFPEDLKFQVTGNRENFQGRYIIRHPWQGDADCEAARRYLNETLPMRLDEEAKNLAHLTGWDIGDIRTQIKQRRPVTDTRSDGDNEPWWSDIWGG